jgi:hypothetical protein
VELCPINPMSLIYNTLKLLSVFFYIAGGKFIITGCNVANSFSVITDRNMGISMQLANMRLVAQRGISTEHSAQIIIQSVNNNYNC